MERTPEPHIAAWRSTCRDRPKRQKRLGQTSTPRSLERVNPSAFRNTTSILDSDRRSKRPRTGSLTLDQRIALLERRRFELFHQRVILGKTDSVKCAVRSAQQQASKAGSRTSRRLRESMASVCPGRWLKSKSRGFGSKRARHSLYVVPNVYFRVCVVNKEALAEGLKRVRTSGEAQS